MNNKSGIAIIPIIIALAMVGAGTALIMNLNKSSQKTNTLTKNISLIELEKKRVSAILSDNQACKVNFGGAIVLPLTKTSLVTKTGKSLVTKGQNYYDKMIMADNIVLSATTITPPPGPNDYELTISYKTDLTGVTAGTDRKGYTGKNASAFKIPMYLKIDAGVLTDCYAKTENDQIDAVISNACSPTTSATNRISILTKKSLVSSDCKQSVIFADNANLKSACATGKFIRAVTLSIPALSADSTITYTGQSVTIPPTSTPDYCEGMIDSGANTCTIAGQSLWDLNKSVASCSYAGGTRDSLSGSPSCSVGQIMYMTNLATTSCVTVDCSLAATGVSNSFVQSVGASGPATCYKAPASSCPANYYVYQFTATGGNTECLPLPVISNSCAAGEFGYNLTKNTTTSNGKLECKPFSKVRNCTTPGSTTFVQSFGSTTTNCIKL